MTILPVLRKIFAFYILWVFIHIVFLSLGWAGEYHDEFWPLTHSNLINSYDVSEFLVYAIGPAIIFFVLYLIYNSKKINSDSTESSSRQSLSVGSNSIDNHPHQALFSRRELNIIKYIVYAIILLSLISNIVLQLRN